METEKQKQKQKKKIFFFIKNKNNLLSKKLSTKIIKYDIFVDINDKFSMIHDKKKNILIFNGNHPSNFIKEGNIYKYINVSNIKKIRNGATYTLFLTKNNKLFSFGDNKNGQCGIDNIKNPIIDIPKEINFSYSTKKNKIKNIFCFGETSYILLENNELYVFGKKINNYKPQKIIMEKTVDEIENMISSQTELFFFSKTGKIYNDNLSHVTTIRNIYRVRNFYNYLYTIYVLYEDNTIDEIASPHKQKKNFNIPIKIKGKIIKILRNISMCIILTTKGVYSFTYDNFKFFNFNKEKKGEINFFRDKNIINIVLGFLSSMAVSKNGIVYRWGFNEKKLDRLFDKVKNDKIYESPIILYIS